MNCAIENNCFIKTLSGAFYIWLHRDDTDGVFRLKIQVHFHCWNSIISSTMIQHASRLKAANCLTDVMKRVLWREISLFTIHIKTTG